MASRNQPCLVRAHNETSVPRQMLLSSRFSLGYLFLSSLTREEAVIKHHLGASRSGARGRSNFLFKRTPACHSWLKYHPSLHTFRCLQHDRSCLDLWSLISQIPSGNFRRCCLRYIRSYNIATTRSGGPLGAYSRGHGPSCRNVQSCSEWQTVDVKYGIYDRFFI
ncbi:hypothetical protein ARMSODRAFT_51700 [Armillaria solidipes]|uniref:Uncharacterized protein n=1 Tax=Armillaria solidipes TaxID=1076256 RepID=A0A2H3CHP9_9AGAR|nr:hypothetical protein ARMSODRAFT_51700 [Armillaria solidipes]